MTVHSNDAFPAERRSFMNLVETNGLDTRHITDRQLECLAWVQQGKSATDIGGILGLSGRTVEKHIIKVCGQCPLLVLGTR